MKKTLTCIIAIMLGAVMHAADGNTARLYCRMAYQWWTENNAAIAIYTYADGDVINAAWPGIRMSPVEGQGGLWYADVDTTQYTHVIFVRVNDSGTVEDWGAKTGNLAIPHDGTNLYTITSTEAVWSDPGVEGTWSIYDNTTGYGGETITVYSLVGDSALFGTAWDVSNDNTNMVQTGDYQWTYTAESVHLKAYSNYEYKVIANHSWDVAQYPKDDNYSFSVTQSGTYSILFTFVADGGATATPTLITADEGGDETTNYSNYSIVINYQRMVHCAFAGYDDSGNGQYVANVQLYVGDTIYVRDRAENHNMDFDIEEYGDYAHFRGGDIGEYREYANAVCEQMGCYAIFWKPMSNTIYIGASTDNCSEGEPYNENTMQTASVQIGVNGYTAGPGYVQINDSYHISSYQTYTYLLGSTVTIEALPGAEYQFLQWTDNNYANPRELIVTGDTTIWAEFGKLSLYPTGILLNRKKFIRSTYNDGIQLIVRANIQEGDTVELYFINDNIFFMEELEPYGEYEKFSGGKDLGYLICHESGCYDIYFKLEDGITQSIYIGQGTQCFNGEDWTEPTSNNEGIYVYSLVGTENLFSVAWNTEDTTTNMQLTGDGMYVYTLDSVTLIPEGDYQYKVIANHAWNIEEYPSVEEDDNYHITVEESGVYSVLFSLQPGLGCNATTNYLHAVSNDTPAIIASGECAADGSSSVTWLLTGDSILTIGGNGAMADYNEETVIAPWYEYKDAYHSVYIASGVTNVGNLAFQQSANLRYVDLASTVISLGNYCFYNCPALHSLTLPESLTSVGDNTPFGGNTTITSAVYNSHVFVCLPQDYTGEYTVEPGTTIIASDAFKRCNMLTSVVLPSSVTTLTGSSTFEECSALASVNIPDGVTTLGLYMFSGCSSLRFINLPASVTSIGSYCFGDCSSVDSLVCHATTPPEANGSSFAGISETVPVYVPLASLEQYRATDGWSGFSNYHAIDDGSPTEPDVPEEYTLPLDTNWTFIMLPGAFGLSADDVTADGELVWARYNGVRRASGNSGWATTDVSTGFMADQAYIVRAARGTVTLTIHVPEQAREKSATNLSLGYYEAGNEMNANWNFLGNPYPFAFDIMAAFEAADIESPIAVWNGTGYTTYTPGIDAYVLEPFGAFFIQLPNGGPTIFPLSPEYLTE